MKQQNPFRLRAKTPKPAEIPQPKPAEMTDAELEDGIRQARREILDAQHAELRIRERARLAPGDASGGRTERRNLGSIFNRSNRRFK